MRPVRLSPIVAALAVAALPLLAAPLAGQSSRLPDLPALQRPFLDWDRGAYDEAIEGYLDLLDGPGGADLVEPIAEATGELHPVREITRDGARAAVSRDGAWASYVTVENGVQSTHVVSLAQGRAAVTLPGGVTAFMDGGRVAYAVRGDGRPPELRIRPLPSGRETVVPTGGWTLLALAADGEALIGVAAPPAGGPSEAVVIERGALRPLGARGVQTVRVVPGGRWIVVGLGDAARREQALIDRQGGPARRFANRSAAAVSADGSTVALLGVEAGQNVIEVLRPADGGAPRTIVRTPLPLAAPALSPSGATVAYQKQPLHDWEIFAKATGAAADEPERQLTFEIQHDALPRFLDEDQVLAVKGEPRHRRSYLYSIAGRPPLKLFHNNTVRTIAAEYEWVATADGSQVVIVADRDGDVVSPARGVYALDLRRTVTAAQLRERLQEALGAEKDLRARASRTFLPIGNPVRLIVGEVSTARIEAYAQDLFQIGSRAITRPGNARAIQYLVGRLREFGYSPEVQGFEPVPGVRTANVIARLEGTTDPDLVYVVSAHLDSVEEGPGSDDDGSGVTALLEAARVMRSHPLAATVEFVFFTGEEAGLYGSLEYVRRAIADGKQVSGVVNNDMIGFANDHRMDMTIRWSNPGIRDVMHGAALLFTDLITYDARYYRFTDAGSLNDGFGDIVGGMGAFPILGNPYYHQPTDRIETVDQRLVTEACRTTIASAILLASTPRPVRDLAVRATSVGALQVSWSSSPEKGVIGYELRWTDRLGALKSLRVGAAPGSRVTQLVEEVRPGSPISVKAVADDGREGWDWATVSAPR